MRFEICNRSSIIRPGDGGEATANKYLDELEAALDRVRQNPDLLKAAPDLHAALRFYRVNTHLLVCEMEPGSIVVLTVVHTSMDIPALLGELQPTLATEVEFLRSRLRTGRGNGNRSGEASD